MADKKKVADVSGLSFEDALAELEQIVRQLEDGGGKLDDAIGAYERGAALKKHCEEKLREARVKVDRISIGPGGEVGMEPADIE